MYLYTLDIELPEAFHDFIECEVRRDVMELRKKDVQVSDSYTKGLTYMSVHLAMVNKDERLDELIKWLQDFYNAKLTWTNRKEVKLND